MPLKLDNSKRGRLEQALEALKRYKGRIIDAHAHIGSDHRFLMRAEPERVLSVYDRCGIRAGLFSSTISLLCGVKEGNQHVLEGAKRHPGRILPLYSLNPLEENCLEMLKELHELFYGVKFHPDYFGIQPSHPLSLSALRQAADLGLPLMLHSYDGGAEAERVARELPGLTVVAYHMGGVRWTECLRRLAKLENTLVEISSSLANPGMVKAAVDELGADRVLFGTDVPYNDPAVSLAKVLEADLSEREREGILWRNAERLIGGW
ncbi:MAG: amidohydrolase family protein [Thermofilaceae archaeon]